MTAKITEAEKKPSPLTHIYMTAHFEDLVHVVQ
jgi:hypothetical protein